jgi:hypothetical protein
MTPNAPLRTLAAAVRAPLALALVFAACARDAVPSAQVAEPAAAPASADKEPLLEGLARKKFDGAPGVASALRARQDARGGGGAQGLAAEAKPEADDAQDAPAPRDAPDAPGRAPARRWFPETFLFEPELTTDAEGRASLAVRIPDRLTTWRVLALAHTQDGHTGGAIAELLGTLPVYVDLALPPALALDDVVTLAVQVVNTSARDAAAPLTIELDGLTLVGARPQSVSVAAGRSIVVPLQVRAARVGRARLAVSLAGHDGLERTIEIRGTGRQVSTRVSTTLGARRVLTLARPPEGAIEDARLVVELTPGPLEHLRQELDLGLGGPLDPAYALRLAATSTRLAARLELEDPADPQRRERRADLVRRAIAGLVVATRAGGSVEARGEALVGAASAPADAMARRLAARLADGLADATTPDGSCGAEGGQDVQRAIVRTAACRHALREAEALGVSSARARFAIARQGDALARLAPLVDDAFTAAAALASGPLPDDTRAALRRALDAGIKADANGALDLVVADDVARADGLAPEPAARAAMAALALDALDDHARAAALVARALEHAARGAPDPTTRALVLQAVERALARTTAGAASLTVAVGASGRVTPLGAITVTPLRRQERARLEVALAAGPYTLDHDGPASLAGVGVEARVVATAPWSTPRGAALARLDLPPRPSVGAPLDATLTVSVPRGRAATLELGLPAGVELEAGPLDDPTIAVRSARGGRVVLAIAPRPTVGARRVRLPVRAAFAGRLAGGPLVLDVDGERVVTPPTTWSISAR